MIHSFTFKNFYSFAETATISFVDIRKGIETKNNMFCDSPSGERLSKVTTIVGPNASGKTSALKALAFLSWFVLNSFVSLKGDEDIPMDCFAFSEDKNSISEFELVFEQNKTIYKYILHLCKTHVIREELYRKEETQYFNYLFKREWNAGKGNSDISQRVIGLKTEVVKEILRKNISLIAASVAIKNETLTQITDFWQNIIGNVYREGKSWDTSSLGDRDLFRAAKVYNNDQNLFNKAKQFLKDIDLGLESILIGESETSSKTEKQRRYIYLTVFIE